MRLPFTVPTGLAVTPSLRAAPNGRSAYAYVVTRAATGTPVALVERDFSVRRGYYVSRANLRGSVVNTGHTYTALGVGVALAAIGRTRTYGAFTIALASTLRALAAYVPTYRYVVGTAPYGRTPGTRPLIPTPR